MMTDFLTLWITITLLVAPGQDQGEPFEIIDAMHVRQTGAVFFGLGAVNWAAAAPAWIRTAALPSQDSALLARVTPLVDVYGFANVTYPVPVPPEHANTVYYLVSPDGINPVRLDSLQGGARFGVNRAKTVVEDRTFYGYAYGSSANLPVVRGAGFLLRTADSLHFTSEPSSLTADDILLSPSKAGTSEAEYWGRGTSYWDISAQFLFRIEGSESQWLFVQWAPDIEQLEAGCIFRFSLYRIPTSGDPRPVGLGSMDYDCDV